MLFDKHYGEGPGRLLDPTFVKAANDSDYGQTSHTTNSAYLAAYYNTDACLLYTSPSPRDRG